MTAPVHLDGREHMSDPRSNVVLVTRQSRAVLLVMRGPERVRSTIRRVRWKISAQVEHLGAAFDLPRASRGAWASLLPDEITLDPLPSTLQAVALACYPFLVSGWLFKFWVETQDPDARADVWALPLRTKSLRCGLFRLPEDPTALGGFDTETP